MILSQTKLLPQGLRFLSFHDWPSFSIEKLKNEMAFLNYYIEDSSLSQEDKEKYLFSLFYNLSLAMLLSKRKEFTISLSSEKMMEGFHFHVCEKSINSWLWGVKVPPSPPPLVLMEYSFEELENQMRSSYLKDSDVLDKTGTISSLYFLGFMVAFLLWEQSRTKGLFGSNVLTTQMLIDEDQVPIDFVGSGRRFSSSLIVPSQKFHFSNQGDYHDNKSI